MRSDKTLLATPQQALWDYLDTLLQEIPADLPEPVSEAEIQDRDPHALEQELLPSPSPLDPAVSQPAMAPAARELVPVWAENDFQALLFKVGKLTLAVPLITLHSVLNWPETGVTPMPGQPDWCLGLIRYRDNNVRIADTGALVIPADRQTLREGSQAKHILIVDTGRWGLACDAIGSVITLTKDDVRWRRATSSRPWLAGTLPEQLCALLDIEALAGVLDSSHAPPAVQE